MTELYRFINPQGQCEQRLTASLSPETLVALYEHMLLVRLFDQKAIALQRTGKMGTYASNLGQEAISTAMGFAMQKDDVLLPFYRDNGALLKRQVRMSEIMQYWGGSEWGSHYENNPYDFPMCVPIASQCQHAAGVARAFQLKQEKRVAVTTLGDGGTSQGDFYEAMNAAGVWHLPLVIVINNNQWAISVPLQAQTACETLTQKAVAAGIPSVRVDGNDVAATYDVIKTAIDKAREGQGPCLIEAVTYRLCDHTTADDASRYRDAGELEKAWKEEPVIRLKRYLIEQALWSEEKELAVTEQIKTQIENEVAYYTQKAKAPLSDMFNYHYAKLPAALQKQRDTFLMEKTHA